MPFHLAKLSGRPYFAFEPQPLTSAVDLAAARREFAGLELRLRASHQAAQRPLAELCAGIQSSAWLVGDERTVHGEVRPEVTRAVERLSQTGRFTEAALSRANAELLGMRRSSLRARPIWIDGRHPAESWFVGPPPVKLPGLMRDLAAFCSDDAHPSLLRAVVALLQLLQIHPFEDGNGRTARVLFMALALRGLGPTELLPRFLRRLWAFRGLSLHGTSLQLRDSGIWGPYLTLTKKCLETAATDAQFDLVMTP